MEKVSLPFFYHLGAQLGRLADLPVATTSKIDILLATFRTKPNLEALLDSFPSLSVCRNVGAALRALIDTIGQYTPGEGFDWSKPPQIGPEMVFQNVVTKAKEFEIVLTAELQNIPSYHPWRKGAYDTTMLIETAELVLPTGVLSKLGEDVVVELRQSGQCLAFDIPTACGFHMMRGVEAVLHQYYLAVCKPKDKKRLANWGAYIAELRKVNSKTVTQPDVQEIEALLQQLKDRHRNLIMHPEVVLTSEEAFTLFEVGQAAVIAMASRIPLPRAKKK